MKQALDGVEEMQLNKFEAEILKERAENDKRPDYDRIGFASVKKL